MVAETSMPTVVTPIVVSDIDEEVVTRFRDSKAEWEKGLESAGIAAGIQFAENSAGYGELSRLERWWSTRRDRHESALNIFDVADIADVLADYGSRSAKLLEAIESLGCSDVLEVQWRKGFLDGAVKRFAEIKSRL